MNRFDRIVWNEGMFLTPHHFQQWDRSLQSELGFRRTAMSPFGWGVRRLEIDRDGLANGRFSLLELEAILPDGCVVRAPAATPLPAGRRLDEHFGADQQQLEVFLALPEVRAGVPVCRLPDRQAAVDSRHVGEMVRIQDENDPGKEVEVLVARQNLRLLLGHESQSGYTLLKLAEVLRSAEGKLELNRDYAPASLTLTAAGPALGLARVTLERLAAQASALANESRQLAGGVFEWASADTARFWLMHTANTYLPVLAHYQRHPQTHPLALYLTLSQLVGALCTFSTGLHPRDIPPYDHEGLGTVFVGLERMLRELLDTIIPKRYQMVPLTRREDSLLLGSLADERLLEPNRHFYLGVHGDLPEHRVRDEVPAQLIIGAPHNIDHLVRTAHPGVERTHVAVPPRDFPLKAGHSYFKLETRGEIWETIGEARAIAIYLGGRELRQQSYEMIVMS